jgi:hypothetical protein
MEAHLLHPVPKRALRILILLGGSMAQSDFFIAGVFPNGTSYIGVSLLCNDF